MAQFELTDHGGRQVTAQDFAGSYLLVYFGFTHCKVVCPRSMAKLSGVLDALGARADAITPLYITVDPERDTPERLKSYIEEHSPRFTGLTGTREQIDAAKKAFRVFAERKADPDSPGDYEVPHSAIAYFMAPDGRYVDHFVDTVAAGSIVQRITAAFEKR